MNYKIVGSYDNPAGYAACLTAGYPFCICFIKRATRLWHKVFTIFATLVIACAIIFSQSRAGILSITLISLYLLFSSRISHKKFSQKAKFGLITAFAILCIGLFTMKRNSAIGRTLIWENTIDMISWHPIWGNGTGYFKGNYMTFQAKHFATDTNDNRSILADNVNHPFNEYLLLTVEYGIVGLLLLISLLVGIIFSSKHPTEYNLCIMGICIFACFSYPMRYPFVLILIAYSIAHINHTKTIKHYLGSGITILCGATAIILGYLFIGDIRFERAWYKLTQIPINDYSSYEYVKNYDQLYNDWNGNPYFIYNYAAILNHTYSYAKSNEVIQQGIHLLNDYDIQMLIALNYQNLKDYSNALKHYMIAADMCPNRFMPLYAQMKIYDDNGNSMKAIETAKIILEKPIKVNSLTIREIQASANKILTKH